MPLYLFHRSTGYHFYCKLHFSDPFSVWNRWQPLEPSLSKVKHLLNIFYLKISNLCVYRCFLKFMYCLMCMVLLLRCEALTTVHIFTDSRAQPCCLKLIYCLTFMVLLKWSPDSREHSYWDTKEKRKTPVPASKPSSLPSRLTALFMPSVKTTVSGISTGIPSLYMSSQMFGIWHVQGKGMEALL